MKGFHRSLPLWLLWLMAGGVVALHSAAPAAEFLRVDLIHDGSLEPPGYSIDLAIGLEANEVLPKVRIRALAARPDGEPLLLRSKNPDKRTADGHYEDVRDVPRPEAAPEGGGPQLIEAKFVVAYGDLEVPAGIQSLAFELSLLQGEQVVQATVTELSVVRISETARSEISLRKIKRTPMAERIVLPMATLVGSRAVVEEQPLDVTRITAEVEMFAPERAEIPNGFSTMSFATFSQPKVIAVPKKVLVHYVTNRRIKELTASDSSRYADELAGQVEYGVCAVNLPAKREKGSLETPLFGWKILADPDKHFFIDKLQTMTARQFRDAVRGNDVLLYLHGYNNSFTEPILRAAQLKQDIGFKGRVVTYAWPSQGDTVLGVTLPQLSDLSIGFKDAYRKDEVAARESVTAFTEVLKVLIAERGDRQIHVVAHSMGNRILVAAMQKIVELQQAGEVPQGKPFVQVVSAAPDVATADFTTGAPSIVGLSKRMTFYYSLEDVPLLVSSLLHPSEPRAGRSQIFVAGMDTICADGDNARYLFNWGHTYFAEAPLMISDLSGVVVGQREVGRRAPPLFKQSTTSTPASEFWIFDARSRRGS